MNKMFKISAIAASLLVSGILVGCGSSKSGDETKTPPPIKSKIVTVTDDYVIGANVFAKADPGSRVARGNSTQANGTNSDKPQYIDDSGKTATAPAYVNPKTNKVEPGKYKFAELSPKALVVSNEGVIDLNNNGVADADEPKALSMALSMAKAMMTRSADDKLFVNPFTTLEALTTLDVNKYFDIKDIYIDTTGADVDIRKKVAYANAILAEAQFQESKYENKVDTGETSTDSDNNDKNKIIIPDSFKTVLEKVTNKVKDYIDNGDDLATAIAKLTGKDEYKNLGNTSSEINMFIIKELRSFSNSKATVVEPEKKNPEADKIIIPD